MGNDGVISSLCSAMYCHDVADKNCPNGYCDMHCDKSHPRQVGLDRGEDPVPNPATTKVRAGLLGTLARPLIEVAKVLEHGLGKYPDPNNWRGVPREDHVHAMTRHFLEFLDGRKADKDSKLHPLAHVACRALFIVWMDLRS